jgi:probable rRNA maturation factor
MGEGEWTGIQPHLLGDIVISAETALRDAQAGNMNLEDEIIFLFIHGLLHLLGYNHETGIAEDAARMKAREEEIFFAVRHYHIDRG